MRKIIARFLMIVAFTTVLVNYLTSGVKAENPCIFSGTMSTAAFTWSVDLNIGTDGITYKWNKFDETIPRYSKSSETYKKFGNRFIPWDSIAVWERAREGERVTS